MTFNVLTAEFLHETNTFSVRKTGIPSFEADRFSVGNDGLIGVDGTNTGVAGCLECANAYGWHMTHAISAEAEPSGLVTRGAFDTVADIILDAARDNPPDGVLLPLHGAMVTEDNDDGEGELLRRVRQVIGPDIPIAITLDLHANVTVQMCELANIIVSYKTYPHIDLSETARHAGDILQRTMAGEITPITLLARRPMLVEANGGRTDIGPMIERLERARAYEQEPHVYAVSINAGFESSDIVELGPTVLVTCDGDPTAHQAFAEEMMDDIWVKRDEVLNTYYTVDEVAAMAAEFTAHGAPLIIADYADNPGGGAYGDAPALLKAMLDHGVQDACFGPMVDGQAVAFLQEHMEGETVTLDIGGKTDPRFGGEPLSVMGVIKCLSDGECVGDGPMKGGQAMHFGPTAVLHVDGIDVLVTTEASQIYDQQQFRAFGIDPSAKSVVALKSMQHFRAAFEPMAEKVVVCDSGALCTTNYRAMPYVKVPRPIHPFDPDMTL